MPNVTFTFDCTDRPIGFYADLEFDCMVRSWLCWIFQDTSDVLRGALSQFTPPLEIGRYIIGREIALIGI